MAEKVDKIRTISRSRQSSPVAQTSFIHTKGEHKFFSSTAPSNSFIQPKLQVSQPGDPMEKEADSTADRVMRMSEPVIQPATARPPEDELHRKCDGCEKEEKLHRKGEDDEVQAKLAVNSSGTLIQRVEEKEEAIQTKMEDDDVQRKCDKCEKEETMHPSLLQRVTDDDKKEQQTTVHPKLTFLSRKERGPPQTSPRFVNDLHSSSHGGRAMDNGTRSFMESRFSADFSQVRVHTDPTAVQLSSQISAQAFTHGNNIYFNSGKYNPATESGKHLLAHELTHTIQQSKAPTLNNKVDRTAEPMANAGTGSVCDQYAAAPQSDTNTITSSQVSETETAGTPAPTTQPAPITKAQSETKPVTPPPAPPADAANAKEAPKKITDGDAQFHDLVKETKTKAKGQRKSDDPATKTDEAQQKANAKDDVAVTSAAMVLTTNESVTTEKPKEFSAEEFKKQLKQKIEEKVPNDEKQAREFIKNDNKVNAIVSDTKGNIKDSQKEITQNAENISNEQTINPEKKDVIAQRPGGELTVEDPGKKPAVGEAERVVPKPVPEEDLPMDKEHDADSLDKEMTANNMTDNQLAESEEKSFTDTLGLKQQSQKELCSVPAKLRNAENTQHEADTKVAQGEITHDLNSMHNQRSGQFKGVQEGKQNTQTAEEIQLMLYYNNLKLIYIATETSVKNRLDKLDEEVTSKFQEAIDKAFGTFKENVTSRLDYYYDWHIVRRDYEKEDKFTRMSNSALDQRIIELRWQQMKLKPDDPKWQALETEIRRVDSKRQKLIIEQIFEEEKALFISTVNVTIDEIAIMVANGLNDAKAIIKKGEDDTMKANGTLSDENKKKAADATGDFMAKYKDLDQKVNDKEGELVESLSKQYAESVSKLKKTFEDIRAEAALSWWDKAWRKIKEIALIIYNLGKTLLNILVKAASVIGDILAHPIRFFGNLIDGIGLGFKNFIKNLPKHLEEVMFKLILGVVPPDLKLPEKWDAAGIFSFILSFFGLSKENIRKQAVDYFGEPVVQKLEQAFDLFIIFREKGFAGLWEYVKEKIGDLKNAIIEEVKTFFKEAIIEAAIKYLISMLTPASGFIKVCLSIISVVKFFFTQLVNLLKLLDSILDSMIDIVNGRIENAAKRVESALADILLIGIKFLAALVGINLDKIQAKVSKIINAVRNPVNRAIKWLFDKAKAFAEKTGLLKLIKKGQQKIEAGKEWAKDKVEAGKAKVKETAGAIFSWAISKVAFKGKDGSTHTLNVEESGGEPVLMLRSTPRPVAEFLAYYENEHKDSFGKPQKEAIEKARTLLDGPIKTQLKKIREARNEGKSESAIKGLLQTLLGLEVELSGHLSDLLGRTENLKGELEKYLLEGQVGTYASMPKPRGDQFTADHQPQAAILEWAAKQSYFKEAGVTNMKERATDRAAHGYAINLHHLRHVDGRTYGGKGNSTKNKFISDAEGEVSKKKNNADKREVVVNLIKAELKEDVDAIIDVAEKKNDNEVWSDVAKEAGPEKDTLINQLRKRIIQNEKTIAGQDLNSLKN